MGLRIRAVTRKEVIHIIRDPRTLGVVILLPIVLLVIYGYAINMDVKHLRMAVLDQDRTSAARDLVQVFRNNEYFDVVSYLDSEDEIDRTIQRGEAKLVLVIPRGYSRDMASGRRTSVQFIVDGADNTTASIATSYASAAVQQYSGRIAAATASRLGVARPDLMQPVDYRPRAWYNPELRSTNFIVPGLIAVILMMLSALLTSMTIVRERERGTIEQLVVSPVMPAELMIGKIIPYIVIAFVDIVLVTIAGKFLFEVPLVGSWTLLLVLSALYLVAALGIGLFISVMTETQQAAMTIALMTTMLPAILLSGFMFPIANMPKPIQLITYLIPARYFIVISRGIFLKGLGPGVLWTQAVPLALFGLAALFLSAKKFRKQI